MNLKRETSAASGFSVDSSTAAPESVASFIKGAQIVIPVVSFESFVPLDPEDGSFVEPMVIGPMEGAHEKKNPDGQDHAGSR